MTFTHPRVVGLDLSLTATGLALPDGSTQTVATRQQDGDWRLGVIAEAIRTAVHGATLAVVEDLPVHGKSAGITGMVHGVARLVLQDAGIPYALISPATLKAFATGAGNADKARMALAAYKRAEREFGDDNQCDAWWLRVAGHEQLGAPLLQLPAAQVARLATAKWPAGVAS